MNLIVRKKLLELLKIIEDTIIIRLMQIALSLSLQCYHLVVNCLRQMLCKVRIIFKISCWYQNPLIRIIV